MSYPLTNVFPEFLGVTAIPEQAGKGFSKFAAEQESDCFRPILKADFYGTNDDYIFSLIIARSLLVK